LDEAVQAHPRGFAQFIEALALSVQAVSQELQKGLVELVGLI